MCHTYLKVQIVQKEADNIILSKKVWDFILLFFNIQFLLITHVERKPKARRPAAKLLSMTERLWPTVSMLVSLSD